MCVRVPWHHDIRKIGKPLPVGAGVAGVKCDWVDLAGEPSAAITALQLLADAATCLMTATMARLPFLARGNGAATGV